MRTDELVLDNTWRRHKKHFQGNYFCNPKLQGDRDLEGNHKLTGTHWTEFTIQAACSRAILKNWVFTNLSEYRLFIVNVSSISLKRKQKSGKEWVNGRGTRNLRKQAGKPISAPFFSPLRLLLAINSDSLYSSVPSQRKAPATQAFALMFGQTIPK